MLRDYIKTWQLCVLLIIILLSGCKQSEEETLQEAEENASDVFEDDKSVEVNYTEDSLSFYLPSHLDVIEADLNNIVLESEDHTAIIFYNDLEKDTSDLHYESADDDSALVYTPFEKDDQFGYIRVMENVDEEDEYELQVGIGGVKVTTHVTLKQVPKEAKELMKVAKSIIEFDS